jgi:hypothetical protein
MATEVLIVVPPENIAIELVPMATFEYPVWGVALYKAFVPIEILSCAVVVRPLPAYEPNATLLIPVIVLLPALRPIEILPEAAEVPVVLKCPIHITSEAFATAPLPILTVLSLLLEAESPMQTAPADIALAYENVPIAILDGANAEPAVDIVIEYIPEATEAGPIDMPVGAVEALAALPPRPILTPPANTIPPAVLDRYNPLPDEEGIFTVSVLLPSISWFAAVLVAPVPSATELAKFALDEESPIAILFVAEVPPLLACLPIHIAPVE